MRLRSLPIVALSALLFPSLMLSKARADDGARPMQLDEVLRLARQKNGDLRAAREHLKQSQADVDRTLAALLPTVGVQVKYTHNSIENTFPNLNCMPQPTCLITPDPAAPKIYIQRADQVDFAANASVPLVIPSAYVALRAARQALLAGDKSVEATDAQLLLQVAASFYAAAGADELAAARRNAMSVVKRTLDDSRARFEAGVVNRVDVERAEQAVIQSEQALFEAENTRVSAYRAVRTLAGIDEPFLAATTEPSSGAIAPPRQLIEQALELRPEVAALNMQVQMAQNNKLASQLRWLPALSGFGLFRTSNAAVAFGSAGNFAWSAGLQLDWAIYEGGLRDANARQFASVTRELTLRREQLQRQIAADVEDQRGNIEVKRRAVATATRQIALAKDTLELVRTQYAAGTATQLDVLSAQDQLVGAELNLAQQRFNLSLSLVQLRRATGEFPGQL